MPRRTRVAASTSCGRTGESTHGAKHTKQDTRQSWLHACMQQPIASAPEWRHGRNGRSSAPEFAPADSVPLESASWLATSFIALATSCIVEVGRHAVSVDEENAGAFECDPEADAEADVDIDAETDAGMYS